MLQPKRMPGDLILDRYMPEANEAQREEARENLRGLAEFVAQVEKRLMMEPREQPIRDSEALEVDSGKGASPPQ